MRLTPLVLLVGLAGCHGIQATPTSPSAPARSQAAVVIHLVPTPGELPAGGGSANITVEALGADGLGVSAPVTLAASEGSLATEAVTTDRTGHAVASWQGTKTTQVTATSGETVSILTLKVLTPVALPPPSVPPPPTPQPTPEPTPVPVPALLASISASPSSIAVGSSTTLTASVTNLESGEVVTAYQWDFDGDKTIDETSVSPSRAHVYATDGIAAPTVRVMTSKPRSAVGTGQVIVFKPLHH